MPTIHKRFSHNDLSNLAASVARVARLPGLPTLGWCRQAAEAIATLDPDLTAQVAVIAETGGQTHTDLTYQPGKAGQGNAGEMPPEESEGLPLRIERARNHFAQSMQPTQIHTEWVSDAHTIAAVIALPAPNAFLAIMLQLARGADPDAAASLLDAILPHLDSRARFAFQTDTDTLPEPVTPSEHRVLELLVVGMSIKDIAKILARSPHTIHDHIKSLHRKFNASSRGQLISRALGFGDADSRDA